MALEPARASYPICSGCLSHGQEILQTEELDSHFERALSLHRQARAVPDKLLGVLAMFGAIGILFILPWLDRSPVRSAHYRPMYRIFYIVFIINMLALGYLGVQNAEGIYIILGRTCTAWYFIHFLIIMPLLNVIETPKALPKSISDPIFSSGAAGMSPATSRSKK